MEASPSRSVGPGSILGLVGGAVLIIGSILTWATVSLNAQTFADAFGVDISQLPAELVGTHQSLSGTSGNGGKIAIVCGIVALLAAVLVIMSMGGKTGGVLMVVAGAIGGLVAILNAISPKVSGVSQIEDLAKAQGFTGDAQSFFHITSGIGIWVCIAGGVVAVAGGIMSLRAKAPAMAADMGMAATPPVTMGTGLPPVSPEGSGTMPSPAMPSAPPPPPMDTPDAGDEPPTS